MAYDNNTIETDDSDGSLSGQYILNQYQGWKKEALNLLKSWCIFSYREFYRNLLVIVGELSDCIYGSKTNIPNQLLKMFCLDDERIHTHLRTWTTSGYFGHGFSYSAMIDAELYTIQHQNIRSKQFILDKLVSISTITESIGVCWDTIVSSYFNSGNKDMDDSMENLMTTSNSFEEAYILYSTIKQIKVKMDEKKDFHHQMIHI